MLIYSEVFECIIDVEDISTVMYDDIEKAIYFNTKSGNGNIINRKGITHKNAIEKIKEFLQEILIAHAGALNEKIRA